MKSMQHFFLLALSAAVLSCSVYACKSKKNAAPKDADVETLQAIAHQSYQLEFKPILLDTARYGTDTFEAKKICVSGDTLWMDVSYSGGCKDHVFTARHNGNYMKSLPAQLNIFIDHQGNADGCRELIRETLAFDLRSCRLGKTGALVLLVNGDRTTKVNYTY
jgi:hypothetical protein